MVFALSKGGRPERIVGVVNVLAWLVSLGLEDRERWFEPQLGVFGVDCVYLALLLIMALTTTRTWLLFAAAFQLLEVAVHVATLVDPGVRTVAYLRGMTICSYMLTVSLVIGAWAHARRRSLGHG